jgi:hypothetical protein
MEKCDKCGYEEQEGDRVIFFDDPFTGKTLCYGCASGRPMRKDIKELEKKEDIK